MLRSTEASGDGTLSQELEEQIATGMDGRLLPPTLRAAHCVRRPDSRIANQSNPSGVLIPEYELKKVAALRGFEPRFSD